MGFAGSRWTDEAALLEVVECAYDAFHVMLSMVEVLGGVFRDEVVHVGEAEIRVKVIPCDVVFFVKRAFGHGAFFVKGYSYPEVFSFDGGYLLDSAGVCFFFYALVSVAHLASPFVGIVLVKTDINIVSYDLLYSVHVTQPRKHDEPTKPHVCSTKRRTSPFLHSQRKAVRGQN